MRVIAAGFICCALFFGGAASAEDTNTRTARQAGMTPSDYFYFLDRLAEKIQALFIFDPEEKFSFFSQLSFERTAEMEAVAKEKGRLSQEYEIAAGLRVDHLNDMKKAFLKEVEQKEAEKQKFYEPYLRELEAEEKEQEQARSDVWGLDVKKKELREEIVKARNVGDTARVQELLEKLKDVKVEYDRLVIVLDRVRTSDEIAAEQIEDLFDSRDKAQLIIEKAERAKQSMREDAERRGIKLSSSSFEKLDRLLEQAGGEGELSKELRKSLEEFNKGFEKLIRESEERTKPPEEKELDRRQAEERAAKRKATLPVGQAQEQPQEQQPAQKQESPPPEKQPAPRPLGQPNADTLGGPITFNPLLNFQGTVGQKFEYSFCQPPTARTSDLCTAASTNPTGGKPPYHFQLGSGGFLPFGITLNLNGLMRGTPTAEGTRSFSVCVVDLAGLSVCRAVTFTVSPEEKEEEEPYVPRTNCGPQPQPPAGCSYEFLRCNEDMWLWEYQTACPESTPPPPARDCGPQPMNTCDDQCEVIYEWSKSVDPACSEQCNADFTKRARDWTDCMY